MSGRYLKNKISKSFLYLLMYMTKPVDMSIYQKRHFIKWLIHIKDNKIKLYAGPHLPERYNPVLVETAETFVHFVKLHFKMLNAVIKRKERLDAVLN